MDSEGLEQAVRELAYLKWEQAGYPCGDGIDFWLEAEEEILSGSNGQQNKPGRNQQSVKEKEERPRVAAKTSPTAPKRK